MGEMLIMVKRGGTVVFARADGGVWWRMEEKKKDKKRWKRWMQCAQSWVFGRQHGELTRGLSWVAGSEMERIGMKREMGA